MLQWEEPSGIAGWFSRRLKGSPPGPRSAKFIGPRMPLTLDMVAQRARNDDMPLRAKSGGRLTAAEYPEVLERQWQEWAEMFGDGRSLSIPQPVIMGALALLTLVLAVGGFIFGPMVLGFQGGAVAGASFARASATSPAAWSCT